MKEKLLQYTKSGYFVVLVFDLIAKVLMAVATIFIIRVLSVKDYATYTVFQSISSLMLSILGTGLTVAYVRFAAERISRGESNSKGLFDLCCILMVLFTIIVIVLLKPLQKLYGVSLLTIVLSLLYGLLLSLNKMAQSYFQTEELYKQSGIVTNFKNIALCLIVAFIYFVYEHLNVNHVMVVTIASAAIAFIIGYIWILKRNKNIREEKVPFDLMRSLLRESGFLILYFFLVALFDQICVIIMANVSTDSVLANYGVASKYYMLLLTFLTSISTVLRVKTSNKDMVDNAENRKEFVRSWIQKVWKLSALVCAAAIAVAGFVLPFLNGEGYQDSIPAFRILMVGVFVSYVFAPNVSVMMAAKRHKLLCILAFISSAISGGLCYLLVPILGASGAAIAVVCSNAALNVSCTLLILNEN